MDLLQALRTYALQRWLLSKYSQRGNLDAAIANYMGGGLRFKPDSLLGPVNDFLTPEGRRALKNRGGPLYLSSRPRSLRVSANGYAPVLGSYTPDTDGIGLYPMQAPIPGQAQVDWRAVLAHELRHSVQNNLLHQTMQDTSLTEPDARAKVAEYLKYIR